MKLSGCAILFIFDIDDQIFSVLFNKAQSKYLETVEIELTHFEQATIDYHHVLALAATIVPMVVPTLGGMEFYGGPNGGFMTSGHPLMPAPRVACLILSVMVVAGKSAIVITVDLVYHFKHKRNYMRWLVFDLIAWAAMLAFAILMITIIEPMGQLLDNFAAGEASSGEAPDANAAGLPQ